MNIFIWWGVGVPWACDVPRDDYTQGALQHKLDDGWFSKDFMEILGCSIDEVSQIDSPKGCAHQG
jgi:hypothetical protein